MTEVSLRTRHLRSRAQTSRGPEEGNAARLPIHTAFRSVTFKEKHLEMERGEKTKFSDKPEAPKGNSGKRA